MILGITGMRPKNLVGNYEIPYAIYKELFHGMKKWIVKNNPEKIITGMAQGVDQIAAEIALELKIPFIAACPHYGQENLWSQEGKRKYFDLLDQAEEVCYVNNGGYSGWKMQSRNEWIVNNSDWMLSVWDGRTSGGTCNTINYAFENKKKLDCLLFKDQKFKCLHNVRSMEHLQELI